MSTGPMSVVGYAYPWDVPEGGFLDRVRDLGVDEVAVAVAYHSARAATPWSDRRSAVTARHAAFYRPVRQRAWDGAALRPAGPDWCDDPDAAGTAIAALSAAGIPAAAWFVLTHSSLLGAAHPELAVRNCFGETYPWALCPARPEVRGYAATLVEQGLEGCDVGSVVLEACGPLGAVHQHQHEKTDAVWAPAVSRLLSVCCCDACAGSDGDATRAALRAEIRRLRDTGDLTVTADRLPDGLRETLLATRRGAVDALRAEVRDRVGRRRVVLHASADPWATGALPGLTPSTPDDVDAVVLPGWQPGPASVGSVAAVRAQLPSRVGVGSYVTAVAPSPVPDIAVYVRDLRAAGAGELHLYHLGLAGPARWPDMRAAVRAAHEPLQHTASTER